jgi:hypothetical protein
MNRRHVVGLLLTAPTLGAPAVVPAWHGEITRSGGFPFVIGTAHFTLSAPLANDQRVNVTRAWRAGRLLPTKEMDFLGAGDVVELRC